MNAMPSTTELPPPVAHQERQDRLAASLVDHLGVEGAIRACRSNCWDGVLDRVRRQTPPRITVIHSPDNRVGTLILPPARPGRQRR